MSGVLNCLFFPTTSKFFMRNARNIRCTSSITQELIKQSPTSISQNGDVLITNLKNAHSTKNILDIVNSQYNIMNNRHSIQALRSLFTLQKQGNSDLTTQQILKHPDFEKICHKLKYHVGSIESNELMDILKVITFIGVPSDSTIYQILLQVIRHNINQLTLPHLMFLTFLLKKVKSGPLVDALQIAVPLIFEIQVPAKLDRESLAQMTECLFYVSRETVSEECISIIVTGLLQYKDEYDPKSAVSIVWSLCDMNVNYISKPLLKRALDAVILNGFSLSFRDLDTMLTKLAFKYSSRTPFYYNEVFCDICANYVIDKDLGFETSIHILKKLLKMDHLHRKLLDYNAELFLHNIDLLSKRDPLFLFVIITGIALSGYRPKNWGILKQSLKEVDYYNIFEHKESSLITTASCLCILNIYLPELLEKSLGTIYLLGVFKKFTESDAENILLISQAIRTLKPEFLHYIPNDDVLRRLTSKIRPVTQFPLKGLLSHVFGGASYLKTNIFSKMGHHLDHVIVINKNGSAVPINTALCLEDLKAYTDCQIVIILALNQSHYTINTRQMKGRTSLMIKTLEASDYVVVPICLEVWTSLNDIEKIPYVLQEIQTKIGYCKSNQVR